MVPFAEMVMFKIPNTKHRVGSFEDRWELGCWVGIVPRSGEHLVATDTGVYKVSTIPSRCRGFPATRSSPARLIICVGRAYRTS